MLKCSFKFIFFFCEKTFKKFQNFILNFDKMTLNFLNFIYGMVLARFFLLCEIGPSCLSPWLSSESGAGSTSPVPSFGATKLALAHLIKIPTLAGCELVSPSTPADSTSCDGISCTTLPEIAGFTSLSWLAQCSTQKRSRRHCPADTPH